MEWEQISNALGYNVNKANSALRNSFQDALNNGGIKLTPEQWGTLNYIYFNPNETVTNIANVTFRDKTSVTRMIEGLVKKGYISRKPDTEDRRIQRLHLTKIGIELYKKSLPICKKYNEELKSIISREEALSVIDGLNRITNFLNNKN